MKKLILFLLIGALLVLPLSGCFADNKQDEGTTPNNTTENTTPESTTPEVTTPDNPPEVTTPPENNQNNPPLAEGELNKSSDLIVALLVFLEELRWDINWPYVSFADKVDKIKDGAQALHVVFDVNNYYFVCAYNSPDNEKIRYEDCTWVRYDKETAIQKYYNGGKLVKAFQINKALSIIDILSGDTNVPNVEHFQTYDPIFENDVNTADAKIFDQTFIYLNGSNSDTIYHYTGNRYDLDTIPCVHLENQYYLSFYLYTIYADGSRGEESRYDYSFSEYYDVLMSMMEKDKYNIIDEHGRTSFYGVIPIDDFINVLG